MATEKERHNEIADALETLEEKAVGEIEKGDPCIYVMKSGRKYPSYFGFIEKHGTFTGWVRIASKRYNDLVDMDAGVHNPEKMEKVIPLTPNSVDESSDGEIE